MGSSPCPAPHASQAAPGRTSRLVAHASSATTQDSVTARACAGATRRAALSGRHAGGRQAVALRGERRSWPLEAGADFCHGRLAPAAPRPMDRLERRAAPSPRPANTFLAAKWSRKKPTRSRPPARFQARTSERCPHRLGQPPVHPLAPATPQRASPHRHRRPRSLQRRSRRPCHPRRHRQALTFVTRRCYHPAKGL
jgi:hypothetical protein